MLWFKRGVTVEKKVGRGEWGGLIDAAEVHLATPICASLRAVVNILAGGLGILAGCP